MMKNPTSIPSDLNSNSPSIPPGGWLVPQLIRCGKNGCRCTRGQLHGPYHYYFWRDTHGRLRKRYIPKTKVEALRRHLAAQRAAPVDSIELAGIRDTLRTIQDEALVTSQTLARSLAEVYTYLGYYRHKRQWRPRRDFDPILREAHRYDLFPTAIQRQFGFPISKEDYLAFHRALISERKRRNRLSLPPLTEADLLNILSKLPSYTRRAPQDTPPLPPPIYGEARRG